jgi:hypothetical protein
MKLTARQSDVLKATTVQAYSVRSGDVILVKGLKSLVQYTELRQKDKYGISLFEIHTSRGIIACLRSDLIHMVRRGN